ncbi:unnamed protein product [Rotaria socialis]
MNFSATPTATITSTNVPIATTSTITTAAAPTSKPVTRTYRDFERLLTKWQTDFDTKHRLSYENLSQSVRQRDVDLSTYRETLQVVQRDINHMQLQQNHLQDELKLLDTHEKELETNIIRLENDILQLPPLQNDIYSIQQQNMYLNQLLPSTFNERMKNFQLMEQLDSLVKCSTKDLQEIVDKLNEQDDDNDNDTQLPTNQNVDTTVLNEQNIKQLTKTLDSCFKMLTFVDTNVTEIENKVTQTTQRNIVYIGIVKNKMRLSRVVFKLSKQFEQYARFQPTPVTLKSLIDFAVDGDIKDSYKFLRVELLVRWSHMRKEMNYIPTRLLETPSFQLINKSYDQSFSEVLAFNNIEPNPTALRNFTETLVGIRRRHADIIPIFARAYMEMDKAGPIDLIEKNHLQYFYDRIFMNRIGIRTLIYQHTLLFGNEFPQHPQQAGIIDPYCDVVRIVQDAYATAKHLFERASYRIPALEITSHNACDNENSHVTIVYIPAHLYHIVFELLKNSLRATVERYGLDAKEYPPVRVHIVKGHEDVTIAIADRGGGVPRSKLSQLFHYMYSTAPKPQTDSNNVAKGTPIAGFGYGLPIARLYAKYFQGNLSLASVEGMGTWAYVSIKAEPANASEHLPISSKMRYSYTTKKGSDWT